MFAKFKNKFIGGKNTKQGKSNGPKNDIKQVELESDKKDTSELIEQRVILSNDNYNTDITSITDPQAAIGLKSQSDDETNKPKKNNSPDSSIPNEQDSEHLVRQVVNLDDASTNIDLTTTDLP